MSINVGGGELRELKPRILVIGVGGAGGNAINAMIEAGMQGVEFVAVNTDAQDLKMSKADAKIQIGMNLTKGLGAGAKQDIGQAAADESINEIVNYIQGSNMVFIASGMGGGTGTGASHVIARVAREMNILTVGVTTLPFSYEGPKRMRRAIAGLEELKKYLDTTIVVPNQNLFKIANESTGFEESFSLSNDVLKHGVQSITDLMVRPGMINLDFADVETVMTSSGKAMMGTGEAEGENRAEKATEIALNNPLIDEYSLKGARGLLINITGGEDLKLFEVDEIVNKIRSEVDPEAEIINGSIIDPALDGKIRVSIVATALDGQQSDSKSVINMVHRIQNRNPGYSDFTSSNGVTSFNFSNASSNPVSDGANALKLENEIVSKNINTNESVDEVNYQYHEELLKNQEAENIVENISEDNDTSFSQEALSSYNTEESSNDLKEFGVDTDEPDLFNTENQASTSEDLLGSSDEDQEEDDLEIPAFLRRQKN